MSRETDSRSYLGMDAYDWPKSYYGHTDERGARLQKEQDDSLMRSALVKLPLDCPIGFQFLYSGKPMQLEAWEQGMPLFSRAGVLIYDYSSAIESAAAEAWEKRTVAP